MDRVVCAISDILCRDATEHLQGVLLAFAAEHFGMRSASSLSPSCVLESIWVSTVVVSFVFLSAGLLHTLFVKHASVGASVLWKNQSRSRVRTAYASFGPRARTTGYVCRLTRAHELGRGASRSRHGCASCNQLAALRRLPRPDLPSLFRCKICQQVLKS